ncbi:KpsF/GutQ family sugar-phosphate isomerase [Mucisphaera sp.]|uniref:KpsF/GutQ family sugar-phosphate isomerase n=1 Tax=Mucisphaera sp. TaxID=2913024 RepID=UPI003D0D4306
MPATPADLAAQVLAAEADAIRAIPLNKATFSRAVELIAGRCHTLSGQTQRANTASGGALVISGLGKSGLIAQKLSATFASTGTPSHFLHPAEAMHGDLGRVRANDAVLLLSYSGNTDEVVSLAAILKQDRVPTLALVGPTGSDLERLCDITLHVGDINEACPNGLAPTASTTAMLALGDALALAVSQRRDFSTEDFHRVHPGGGLGRQLMPVHEAMRFTAGPKGNLPALPETTTLADAFHKTAAAAAKAGVRRAGALLAVDNEGRLTGIFTDGDLRRLLSERSGENLLNLPLGQVITRDPRTLHRDEPVRNAVRIMRELRIDEIPVIDEARIPLGMIDVQDLVALKVIEG